MEKLYSKRVYGIIYLLYAIFQMFNFKFVLELIIYITFFIILFSPILLIPIVMDTRIAILILVSWIPAMAFYRVSLSKLKM